MRVLNLFFSTRSCKLLISLVLVLLFILSSSLGKTIDRIYDLADDTNTSLESCARYCTDVPECKAWYYQSVINSNNASKQGKCAILSAQLHNIVLFQPELIDDNNNGCYGIIKESRQIYQTKVHLAPKMITVVGEFPLIVATPTLYHQHIPRLDSPQHLKTTIIITPKSYTISLWVWLYKPASHMQAIFTTHSLPFYPTDYNAQKKPIFLPSILIHLARHPNQFFFSFKRDDQDADDFVGLWAGIVQYRQWMHLAITVDESYTARMYLNGEYLDYLILSEPSPNSKNHDSLLHNITETSMVVRCGSFDESITNNDNNADYMSHKWHKIFINSSSKNNTHNNDTRHGDNYNEGGVFDDNIVLTVGDTGRHSQRMRGLIQQFHIHMHQTWLLNDIKAYYQISKASFASSSFMSHELFQQLTNALFFNRHVHKINNNENIEADEAFQCTSCRYLPVSFNSSAEKPPSNQAQFGVQMRWSCGLSLVDLHNINTEATANAPLLSTPWSYVKGSDNSNAMSLLAYNNNNNNNNNNNQHNNKKNKKMAMKSVKLRDIGNAEDSHDNDETDELIVSAVARKQNLNIADSVDNLVTDEEEVVIDLDFIQERLEKEQKRLLFHSKTDTKEDESTPDDPIFILEKNKMKLVLLKKKRAQVRCLYLAARRAIRRTHVLHSSLFSYMHSHHYTSNSEENKHNNNVDGENNKAVSFSLSEQPFHVLLRHQYDQEMKRIPSLLFAALFLADELRDTPLDATATHFPARRHEMDQALSQPVSLLMAQHIHNVYDAYYERLKHTIYGNNTNNNNYNKHNKNNINNRKIEENRNTTYNANIENTSEKSLLWRQIEANDRDIAAAGGVPYILFARPPYKTRTVTQSTINSSGSSSVAITNLDMDNAHCYRRILQIIKYRMNWSNQSLVKHLTYPNNLSENTKNMQLNISEILETVFHSASTNPIYLEAQALCQVTNVTQCSSLFENYLYLSNFQLNLSSVSRSSLPFSTFTTPTVQFHQFYRTINDTKINNNKASNNNEININNNDDNLRLLQSLETALLSPSAIYVGFTFGQRHSGVYAMQSVRLSQASVSQEIDVSHLPLVITGLIASVSRHIWHRVKNRFNVTSNSSNIFNGINNDDINNDDIGKSSISGLFKRNKDHLGQKGVSDMQHMHTEANAVQLQDADAMVWLGKQYYWGFGGFDRDEKKAKEWFVKAANLEHAEGMYNLAAAILRDVRHSAHEILYNRSVVRHHYYHNETNTLHEEGLRRVKAEESLMLTEVETALHWLNKSATHRDIPFPYALQALGSHYVHHIVIVEGLSDVLRRETLQTLLQGEKHSENNLSTNITNDIDKINNNHTHNHSSNVNKSLLSQPWQRHVTFGLHYFTLAAEKHHHMDAFFALGATLLDNFSPIHIQITQAFQMLGNNQQSVTTLALLFLCRAAEAEHVSAMRYLLISLRDYQSWLHVHYLSDLYRHTELNDGQYMYADKQMWSTLYDSLRRSYAPDFYPINNHSNNNNGSFSEQERVWQQEAHNLLIRWHKLLQLPLPRIYQKHPYTNYTFSSLKDSVVSAKNNTSNNKENVYNLSSVIPTMLSEIQCSRLQFTSLEDDTVYFATTSTLPKNFQHQHSSGVEDVPCLQVTSQYMSMRSSPIHVHHELTNIQFTLARKLADFVPRIRDTYLAGIAAYVRDDTALAVSLFDEAADLGHGLSAMNAVYLYEELAATARADVGAFPADKNDESDNNINKSENIIKNKESSDVKDGQLRDKGEEIAIIPHSSSTTPSSLSSVFSHQKNNNNHHHLTQKQLYEGLAQRRWRSLHSQQASLSSLVRLSLQTFQQSENSLKDADSVYFASVRNLEEITATTGAVAGVLQLAEVCLGLVNTFVVPFVTQCLESDTDNYMAHTNRLCDVQYIRINQVLLEIPAESVLRGCVSPTVSNDHNTNTTTNTTLIQSVYFLQMHQNPRNFSFAQSIYHLWSGIVFDRPLLVMDEEMGMKSSYYSIILIHEAHSRIRSLALLALRYEGGLLSDVSPGVSQVHSHGIAPLVLYVHAWLRETLVILTIIVYQSTFCFNNNSEFVTFWKKYVGLERDVWMTMVLFVAILLATVPYLTGWPLGYIEGNEEERRIFIEENNNNNNIIDNDIDNNNHG